MKGTSNDPPSWSVLAVALLVVAMGGLAGCLDGGEDGAAGGEDAGADPGGGGLPADWPSHGLDAANSAAYGSLDGGEGDVLWESASTDTQSSPALAGGLVYVGEQNGMSAWNAATGEQAWWFDDEPPAREDGQPQFRELSTPVVADGTVYVSSIFSSEPGPGQVLALDAETGEEEWRVEFDDALRSAPTVADGLVFVGTERIAGSGNAAVHAVDADSGEEVWTFDVGDNPVVYGSPAVSDGSVIVGTTGGAAPTSSGDHLYKLDAETGDEEWSTEFPGTSSSVAIGDGTVFVESGEEVLAYDEATGEGVWTHDDVGETRVDPTFADGTVYVADEDEDELVALDADTGEELWAFEAAATPPAVAGDTVLTAAIDDAGNVTVHALDAATGDPMWDADLGPADEVSPVAFADGTLVVTQDEFPEATMFALDV